MAYISTTASQQRIATLSRAAVVLLGSRVSAVAASHWAFLWQKGGMLRESLAVLFLNKTQNQPDIDLLCTIWSANLLYEILKRGTVQTETATVSWQGLQSPGSYCDLWLLHFHHAIKVNNFILLWCVVEKHLCSQLFTAWLGVTATPTMKNPYRLTWCPLHHIRFRLLVKKSMAEFLSNDLESVDNKCF